MPIYETVCILHPELSEARVKDVIEGMQKTLEQSQASLLQVEEWGMRNLAYDIQKQRRGYYVRLEYESPPQTVKDFERGLRLSEDTMRFLSVARSAPSDGQSPIPRVVSPTALRVIHLRRVRSPYRQRPILPRALLQKTQNRWRLKCQRRLQPSRKALRRPRRSPIRRERRTRSEWLACGKAIIRLFLSDRLRTARNCGARHRA